MGIIEDYIEKQIQFNTTKNIVSDRVMNHFNFNDSNFNLIKSLALQQVGEVKEKELIDFIVQKVFNQFYEVNQYYTFDQNAEENLTNIYKQLFTAIKSLKGNQTDMYFDDIIDHHYSNLQSWLRNTNRLEEKTYSKDILSINKKIVCAEYSAETQIEILGINLQELKEPIIDLGCGKNAFLVQFLKTLGLDVYGLDRNVQSSKFLIRSGWFDYQFIPDTWGSIISNLGFSNQFVHQHLLLKGDHTGYASKYMELIKSLKPGGKFYYAPDLPFMEVYLDKDIYSIQKKSICANFQSVIIEKIAGKVPE